MDSTRLPIRPDVGAYTASGHTAAFRLFASAKNARRIAKFMEMHCFFKLRRGRIQRRPPMGEEWYGNR